MTKLNAYLNFEGNTEAAFHLYRSVFGVDFDGGIMRYKDVPAFPGKETLSEEELNKVMHVSIRIGDNHLMATDMLEKLGQQFSRGNSVTLSLHPDSKKEADRLYAALSKDGQAQVPMADMFWGDYWGMLTDPYGVQWMINYHPQ